MEAWTNVVENLTTNMVVPGSWVYESSPGTFFWNGVWVFFAFGMLCLAGSWVRRIVAGGVE